MPIRLTVSGSYGETGIADVTVTPKRIRAIFEDSGQSFDILPEDALPYLISGRQVVMLSADNTKIVSARPASGTHFIRFDRFTAKDNEPPSPKAREASRMTAKDGRKWDVPVGLDFTSVFKISRGKWKGYELIQKLPYAFQEFEDTGETQIIGYGSKRCAELLQLCGVRFEVDTIPFSENVLPFLEKVFKLRAKELVAKVEEGWIKSLYEAPEGEDEVEEAPKSAEVAIQELFGDVPSKEPKEDVSPAIIEALKILAAAGDQGAKEKLGKLNIN